MNKFRQGAVIKTMAVLVKELDAGRWIYWNHKPQHPGWIISMTYRTLRQAVAVGMLRKTKENKNVTRISTIPRY